jgi:hypothetical protein
VSAFVINPYSFVSDNISSFTFLQATTSTANATTYTFNNVNFGTADSNRRIVVGVASRSGGGISISSATIGGVSATILAQNTAVGDVVGYITASVPTGTDGTVEIVLNAGAVRLAIATYRVISNSALTLADSDSNSSTATTSTSLSVDAQNGIVLAAATANSGSVVLSFSGIATTDFNQGLEFFSNFAFASERVTATATQSITANRSSSTNTVAIGVCLI